jgi:uncharacterized protein (DUF2267 family)
MSTAGFTTLEHMVEKTNRVLKEIEQEYGWPKERRMQSYSALRAVLHPLRDRLGVGEAAQLAAQLPTLIRGVYYEGWNPSDVPIKMSAEEFLHRVRREFQYDVTGGLEPLVHTVLRALSLHITAGEWDDVRSSMPKELRQLVPQQ